MSFSSREEFGESGADVSCRLSDAQFKSIIRASCPLVFLFFSTPCFLPSVWRCLLSGPSGLGYFLAGTQLFFFPSFFSKKLRQTEQNTLFSRWGGRRTIGLEEEEDGWKQGKLQAFLKRRRRRKEGRLSVRRSGAGAGWYSEGG